MPPKTRRFLGVIHEKLYRNEHGDNFLVFDESDFLKAGSSVGEIEEILVFLKREKAIAEWGTYPVARDVKHFPITREEKESRLRPSFWQWLLQRLDAGDHSKDRYVLELVSRNTFYAFYQSPFDQSHYERGIAAAQTSTPKNHKFPSGLAWQEITLKFLNGEEVMVKYRDTTFTTTAEGMGFMDNKTKSPNAQWRLMRQLASHGGELSWSNNSDLSKNDKDAMKKRKQELVKGLWKYFGIKGDPFFPYKEINAYRMRITLIPESRDTERDDDMGIRSFHREQTPNIDDR
jgi:hypothetical protein